ncbi:Serine/threonine-protein kinase-like protein cr4 [Asimina triloba]
MDEFGKEGPFGGGGILRDASDNFIGAFSNHYGVGSNNRAELKALFDGIRLCKSSGSSTWVLKMNCKPLLAEVFLAMALVTYLPSQFSRTALLPLMESYVIRSLLGITSHVESSRIFRFELTVGAHASHLLFIWLSHLVSAFLVLVDQDSMNSPMIAWMLIFANHQIPESACLAVLAALMGCISLLLAQPKLIVTAISTVQSATHLSANSKEFHNELDLLSRLNHAHLLNLLGYCVEGGERLPAYEFMAHGSMHQHLHGKNTAPVIKSSNILIVEEHNARVADFGLSFLGPADSSSPLSELPAVTFGFLDPEYYRLHYLTTKSDVFSFNVLLLVSLCGRKAIDMQYEEGNIVEWAVPMIKAGDIFAILVPVLKPPADLEALKRIVVVACKCVRMRGKEWSSMDRVTTALEQALAYLMGSPCNETPFLPTEVVLGSSRLHKNPSQVSSNLSSEMETVEAEDLRCEFRAPSWITFPSVVSSERRKLSVSEADVDARIADGRNAGGVNAGGDSLRCLEEEISTTSPQEDLFLQHNF